MNCVSFFRLLTLAISSISQYMHSLSGGVRASQLSVVHQFFELCWSLWRKGEEEAKARELEEQNLYRYRTKEHVVAEPESNVLDEQLKALFPSHAEFMDEDGSCDPEDASCDLEKAGKEEGSSDVTGGAAVTRLSQEEVEGVASLHLYMYGASCTEAVSGSAGSRARIVSYQLASSLANTLDHVPGW